MVIHRPVANGKGALLQRVRNEKSCESPTNFLFLVERVEAESLFGVANVDMHLVG
jgi:hypothetical protein